MEPNANEHYVAPKEAESLVLGEGAALNVDRSQEFVRAEGYEHRRVQAALARSLNSRTPGHADTRKQRCLELACDYIEEHLGDDFSMPDICRNAHVSMKTLERLFHNELRTTPSKYIRNRRLDSVRQEMLHSGNGASITDLATKYGLCHLGRFSKYFREHFGVLPSELRHAGQ